MRIIPAATVILGMVPVQAMALSCGPSSGGTGFTSFSKSSNGEFATKSITNLGLTGQRSEEDARRERQQVGEQARKDNPHGQGRCN